MPNDVINGETIKSTVAKAIADTFVKGTDYEEVYKEKQLQKVAKPYFFIQEVKVERSKNLTIGKSKHMRTSFINVTYEPRENSPNPNEDCARIGVMLTECLELIGESGNQLRGSKINYKVKNNILEVEATYKLPVEKAPQQVQTQQQIEINERVK